MFKTDGYPGITARQHWIGLTFTRTVNEVREAMATRAGEVEASITNRVKVIGALLAETKSADTDVDNVILWAGSNPDWGTIPLREQLRSMLTQATQASLERNILRQLNDYIRYLSAEKDPQRILELHETAMDVFDTYDVDTFKNCLPSYHERGLSQALGVSRFGGHGSVVDKFDDLAGATS